VEKSNRFFILFCYKEERLNCPITNPKIIYSEKTPVKKPAVAATGYNDYKENNN